jgi:hypothetical protein
MHKSSLPRILYIAASYPFTGIPPNNFEHFEGRDVIVKLGEK